MLAISAIVFCAINCRAQDLALTKNSNDATTRRSQQESGLTVLQEYSRTDNDPIEEAEPDIDLDDIQEEQRDFFRVDLHGRSLQQYTRRYFD